MFLDKQDFYQIIKNTPLLSIDLIVTDGEGAVLLGRRSNRPAQGYWFAPGGRVYKNETLDRAFARITFDEIGFSLARSQARLKNVYEHFYSDSYFGEGKASTDTHYVVLGYQLSIYDKKRFLPPLKQHDRYRWWTIDELRSSEDVHEYTRAYFN